MPSGHAAAACGRLDRMPEKVYVTFYVNSD